MKTTTPKLPYDRGYKAGFEGKKYENPFPKQNDEYYEFEDGFNSGTNDGKDFLIGQNIVTLLNLEVVETVNGQNRYNTFWGTKSEIGLARSLRRIIEG